MSHPAPTAALSTQRLALTAGLVSFAVIGFEIALMRLLLLASWHHFAFLVITIALLGFAASGSLLYLARPWVLARPRLWLWGLALATALSMPLAVSLLQGIELEARFLPATFWSQAGAWLLYWAVLAVVFTLGASVVGLTLMLAGRQVGTVYAANLAGSGLGAAGATVLMFLVDPPWLAAGMGIAALLALIPVGMQARRVQASITVLSLLALAVCLYVLPPAVRMDPFKYRAHVQRLVQQDRAERVAMARSPHGVVEVFASPMFHDLPFLSVGLTPPAMLSLVIDGHHAGSILQVSNLEQAAAVDQTLMATAHVLQQEMADDGAGVHPRRVLLLGERGTGNIWLALRHGAAQVDVVQPDPAIARLLRGPLRHDGGAVLQWPGVTMHVDQPRHFVQQSRDRYDVIQLVALEVLTSGGSMAGLGQDHLVTVQGLAAALNRLQPNGLLSISRGIQNPPRDNLKLLTTAIAALKQMGVTDPSAHIVIVRDFLGVNLLIKPTAWNQQQLQLLGEVVHARRLTPVWFTGITPDQLNKPDHLPGPPDATGDWYHHTAQALFSDQADALIRDWVYDIRPPTDVRPFFLDFFRLGGFATLREAFGDLWMTRMEMAYLFVLVVLAVVAGVGAVLMIAPLLLVARGRVPAGAGVTALYFMAIGLAYLMLEITLLARLTHLIGDPVTTAAVTIATFLIASGLGSAVAARMVEGGAHRLSMVIVLLVFTGAAQWWLIGQATLLVGGMSEPIRILLGIVVVAPLAFLMGFPMPVALARLHASRPQLVGWAWGVNGYASVLSPPLTMLIAMSIGFHLALAIALGLYLLVPILFVSLRRVQARQ